MLLSMDFLKLIFIAMIIAFPLTAWALSQWLNDFAYRIDIGINVFLIAGLSITMLAISTVGYQAVKAALRDPVKSLRSE